MDRVFWLKKETTYPNNNKTNKTKLNKNMSLASTEIILMDLKSSGFFSWPTFPSVLQRCWRTSEFCYPQSDSRDFLKKIPSYSGLSNLKNDLSLFSFFSKMWKPISFIVCISRSFWSSVLRKQRF